MSSRRLQDMSSRHLQGMSSRRLQDMSSRRLQDMSSRHLEDVFSIKMFRVQDSCKISSRRLCKHCHCYAEDVLKTSSAPINNCWDMSSLTVLHLHCMYLKWFEEKFHERLVELINYEESNYIIKNIHFS